MEQDCELATHELATALWRCGRPATKDLDNWLAAERMISQAATARRAPTLAAKPRRSLATSALPVERVRDLAFVFWLRAGEPPDMALTFWLAAERHVQALCRAVLFGDAANEASFSASTYCARLDERARLLWERAGSPQGRDLDFWLSAEAAIMAEIVGKAGVAHSPDRATTEAPVEDTSKLSPTIGRAGEAARPI